MAGLKMRIVRGKAAAPLPVVHLIVLHVLAEMFVTIGLTIATIRMAYGHLAQDWEVIIMDIKFA
jgi:hypothetical protein